VITLKRLVLLLTALVVLIAAGCGGDDGDSSSSGGDPQAILDDARKALGELKSFHMEGTAVDKSDGEQTLSGDIALPGRVQLKLTTKEGTAEILLADKTVFFRADRDYWQSQNVPDQALSLLVDKWVKAPSNQEVGAEEFLALSDPAKIGKCLIGDDSGTLAGPEKGEVDGTPVDIVIGKGDKPGTSPGRLSVAAEGDPLPLRFEQTGPQKPGGTPDAECGDDGDSDTQSSDIRLSKFDEPVDIKAPADALDLEQLQNQSSS
jgi:hypothetical protein